MCTRCRADAGYGQESGESTPHQDRQLRNRPRSVNSCCAHVLSPFCADRRSSWKRCGPVSRRNLSTRNVHGGQTPPLPKPAVRSGDWPLDCGALGKTWEIPGGNLIEMTPPLQYAFIDATTDSSARRSSWRRQPCATTLFVCRSCQPRRVINSAHPHNSRSRRPVCNEVARPGRPLRRAQQ